MKKSLQFAFIFGVFLMSNLGFSQTTDNATLNVVLQDIQSITVAPAQETVTLNLSSVSDYQNGVNLDQANHLAVVSTFDFDITAQTETDLTKSGETNTIPVSTITLQASAGTDAPTNGTYPSATFAAPLTPINIVTGASADLDANYNVNYAISGGAEYLNQPAGTYATTITYTLVPQ